MNPRRAEQGHHRPPKETPDVAQHPQAMESFASTTVVMSSCHWPEAAWPPKRFVKRYAEAVAI
jgi:hypothetical protein